MKECTITLYTEVCKNILQSFVEFNYSFFLFFLDPLWQLGDAANWCC